MRSKSIDVTQSEESEETGMALADVEDLEKGSNPLLNPSTKSQKEHPPMAVYVAVGTHAKTKQKIEKQVVQKLSFVENFDTSPAQTTIIAIKKSLTRPSKIPVAINKRITRKKPVSVKTHAIHRPVVVIKQEPEIAKFSSQSQTQMKVTTIQMPLPEIDNMVQKTFNEFNDVSYCTVTDDDITSPKDRAEEVYSVEFVTDARQLADTHQRVQRLIAKESFSVIVDQTQEQVAWLKEMMSEAKAFLWRATCETTLLEPEKRATVICAPDRKKPLKVSLASAFAQNLMQTLINEVFDPAKMLEVHIAVRLNNQMRRPPLSSGGDNYNNIDVTTSVSLGQPLCSTKSCKENETCKTETCKFAKTVFLSEICGRPMLIDDRFIEIINRNMNWSDATVSWSTKSEGTPSAAFMRSPSSTVSGKQSMSMKEESAELSINTKSKESTATSNKNRENSNSQQSLFTADKVSTSPLSATCNNEECFSTLKTESSSDKLILPFSAPASEKETQLKPVASEKKLSNRASSVIFEESQPDHNAVISKSMSASDQSVANQRFVIIPNSVNDKKKSIVSSTSSSAKDKESRHVPSNQLRMSVEEPTSHRRATVSSVQNSKSSALSTKPTEKGPNFDDQEDSDLYYYKLIANMNQLPRYSFRTSDDFLCFNCGYDNESGQKQPCIRHRSKTTQLYRNHNRRR